MHKRLRKRGTKRSHTWVFRHPPRIGSLAMPRVGCVHVLILLLIVDQKLLVPQTEARIGARPAEWGSNPNAGNRPRQNAEHGICQRPR